MDPNQMPPEMPVIPPQMPPQEGEMPQASMMPSMPEPEVAPAPQPLPEWNRPPEMNNKNDGHKKQLLQKMMANLLGKPGRSVNEIINGVKAIIGAYKNYAKEWDTLNGITETSSVSGPMESVPTSGGQGGGDIQKILRSIQEKKVTQDGGGGPGISPQTPPRTDPAFYRSQNVPPAMPATPLIAGQSQQSDFNRPAPVSNFGVYGF